MKHTLISTMMTLGAICGPGSAQSFAEDEQPAFENVWITAPQICRGKPWSSTAKAAGWKVVAESGACRATGNDSSMIAHVSPMEHGRFVVNVALQMQNGATVQLFLDEIALDVSHDGQTICVAGGPEFLRFDVERTEGQRWSELRIEREQETLIVTLNGKEVIRFDDKGRSYERVGLKPIGGTTDVNRFSLTGHLARQTQKRGERLLGIGINEGSIGFDKAFPVAQSAGMQFVELPQQWDEIERKAGKFTNQWLDIANAYYPRVGVRLVISLNPIDTNSLRMPEDLKGKPFDHPDVIARYKKAVDYVLGRLPNATFVAFSIGNEIDAFLGADAAQWAQYERFFRATADYVRRKKPGVPVGAKVMLPSVIGDMRRQVEAVNQHADAVFVTYYPLKGDFRVKSPTVVHDDIGAVVKLYSGKPVYFLEAGYPSSPHLGSSEQRQAEFVREIFKAWDRHQNQIRAMNLIWLHDISTAEVNTYKKYYGVNARSFGEYLGTLGLRTHNGKDKQAFQLLRREAEARGW